MEKFEFEFELVADDNQKSNVLIIKSIKNEDGEKFLMPQCYQSIKHHVKLSTLPEVKRVAKALQKRGQCRNVWIKLDEEMLQIYKDDSGNMVFDDFLLNTEEISVQTSENQLDASIAKVFEKLSHSFPTEERKQSNINKICDKFVLDKYEGKNMDALQWLETYESECNRLGIESDVGKIEGLRLFIDKAVKDWFSSMLIKHTLNSEWNIWREQFLTTFATKGWSSTIFALSYKYVTGSMLDYALKKERLMLESNKNIDNRTLVDLIVFGLPSFVRDKINRQDIENSSDLFAELRKYENITGIKSNKMNENRSKLIRTDLNLKQPCKICERKGHKNRYHTEDLCWFKEDKTKSMQRNNIVNSVLEIDTTEDPKN